MPPRETDEEHLAWVHEQSCLVCKRTPVDAHHLLRHTVRGMGRRASDRSAVPLCREHHEELHRAGDEKLFFALKGVDAYAWADKHGDER